MVSALLRLFFCLLILSPALSAHAAATYTGEAAVSSQSDSERHAALQSALSQVVVQLTGDVEAPSRGDMPRDLAEASRKPLQFQYRRSDDGALLLVAQFDADMVNDLLRRNELAAPSAASSALGWTPSEATVRVEGVRNATDFARAMRFLSSQEMVRSVAPQEAEGESVLIRLSLATDLTRLLDAVDTGSLLRVLDAQPSDGSDATLGFAR